MRVLHLVESFGGGVLTSVSQLCNIQAEGAYEVYLAHSMREETPLDFKNGLNPKVKTIKINVVRNINLIKDIFSLYEIWKLIKNVNPDIIHLHSSKAGFLGRIAAFFAAKKARKVFYSPRGFSFLQTSESKLKRFLYFLFEKIGTFFGGTIVACSQGEALVAQRLTSRKIAVVENAVDIKLIPCKTNYQKNKSTLKIGTLGRLCPQKNPLLFKKLAEKFLDNDTIQFYWVGGGEDVYKLNNIPNLQVTGWLPRKDALKFLSDLDIYVQTSLWEGMPLSVIEAMCSGVPAVVTDIIGNHDVVDHGQTGFLVKDVKELKEFVDLLIRDWQLRIEMGSNARQQGIQRFNLKRLEENINKLYLEN